MSKKIDTQNKILDVARDLMLREGFHGVTVDRIIAEAGISKGSFFYHFASKDALPCALLERYLALQGDEINRAFVHAQTLQLPPLATALWVIDAMEEIFAGNCHKQTGCVMAAFSYQLIDAFPQLREVSRKALADWQQAFSALFAPLVGQTDPAAAEELAMHFMALLQGANVLARLENSNEAIHGAIKHFKLYLTLSHSQA